MSDIKEGDFLLPSLKRGGSELVCEPDAKRQQLSILSMFDAKELSDSELEQQFYNVSDNTKCEPKYSLSLSYMILEPRATHSVNGSCCDDDAENLLNGLPTSVDDFRNKELNFKKIKSPFISKKMEKSACDALVMNQLDDIPWLQPLSPSLDCDDNQAYSESFPMITSSTNTFYNFFDSSPDEEDLEVARINECFEEEQMQYQIYESQNLRSVFYGSLNESKSADTRVFDANKDLNNQLQGMILSGNINTADDASKLCMEFRQETSPTISLEESSPTLELLCVNDRRVPDECDVSDAMLNIAHGIVKSLLSSPSLEDESELLDECCRYDNLEPKDQVHSRLTISSNFISNVSPNNDYLLSDDMLKNIQDELFFLMDDDDADAELYLDELLKSEREEWTSSVFPISSEPSLLNEEQLVPVCHDCGEERTLNDHDCHNTVPQSSMIRTIDFKVDF